MNHPKPLSVSQFNAVLAGHPAAFVTLGAPEDAMQDAWGQYLAQLRESVDLATYTMGLAYDSLRDARLEAGLPLFEAAKLDPNGAPITWSKELDEHYANIHAMAMQIIEALGEALDGSRKTVLTEDGWGLELLPSDPFQIALDAMQRPVLLDNPLAPPVGVGAAPLAMVIVAAAIVKLIISAGVLYVVYSAIDAVTNVILAILDRQRAQAVYNCLDKHTPEECAKANEQILAQANAQRSLEENRHKKPEEGLDSASKLALSLLAVAAGATGLYFAIKYLPPVLDEKTRAHAAA